jgi:hypothetical protein
VPPNREIAREAIIMANPAWSYVSARALRGLCDGIVAGYFERAWTGEDPLPRLTEISDLTGIPMGELLAAVRRRFEAAVDPAEQAIIDARIKAGRKGGQAKAARGLLEKEFGSDFARGFSVRVPK